MTAWHETEECRLLCERTELAMAGRKYNREESLEHDIKMNEWRHAENIKRLEQCLRYAKDGNFYACESLIHRYMQQKQSILSEKLSIGLMYELTKYPECGHREQEKALLQDLNAAIAQIERKGRI